MAEKYEHWRSLGDNTHLRAETLAPGEEKVLTIKEVKREKVKDSKGGENEKPVAYFYENELPMVLNVTNCKTIEKVYGTGNIYDWVGKKIQVFATTTKVGGQSTPCLRVRNFEPKTNEVEYKCSVCGKVINESVYKASVQKYGKAYCSKDCLDKEKNGENLL